jgi:antitoxin MazE
MPLRMARSERISFVDTFHPILPMITSIQRWGNSLAIRIPKAFALQAELAEHTSVDLAIEGGTLVVRPVRKEWTLDELLGGVTDSNLHRETSWGESTGKEVW